METYAEWYRPALGESYPDSVQHVLVLNDDDKAYLLVFDLGSLGPSTVTLMALLYVATCGGLDDTIIVNVKLFPARIENLWFDYMGKVRIVCCCWKMELK